MTRTGIVADVDAEVLDHLIWNALDTTHRRFAEGDGLARRYQPDVAGFVAVAEPSAQAWADLHALVGPGETLMLSQAGGLAPPADWERAGSGFGNQMVLGDLVERPSIDLEIQPLSAADVPQMLALVELTKPGPFRPRTIELGNYFGVFVGKLLVAMAGERLQTPGFTEISAVCTRPHARGRGLAAALTHHVATGILERGQTPLLHVAQTNVNAQRVYERLGFVVRRQLEFAAVVTPSRLP